MSGRTRAPGGGGDEIHAYVVRPEQDGPLPGIVAVHHMPGWDEFYQEFSERLGRHGPDRLLAGSTARGSISSLRAVRNSIGVLCVAPAL